MSIEIFVAVFLVAVGITGTQADYKTWFEKADTADGKKTGDGKLTHLEARIQLNADKQYVALQTLLIKYNRADTNNDQKIELKEAEQLYNELQAAVSNEKPQFEESFGELDLDNSKEITNEELSLVFDSGEVKRALVRSDKNAVGEKGHGSLNYDEFTMLEINGDV